MDLMNTYLKSLRQFTLAGGLGCGYDCCWLLARLILFIQQNFTQLCCNILDWEHFDMSGNTIFLSQSKWILWSGKSLICSISAAGHRVGNYGFRKIPGHFMTMTRQFSSQFSPSNWVFILTWVEMKWSLLALVLLPLNNQRKDVSQIIQQKDHRDPTTTPEINCQGAEAL